VGDWVLAFGSPFGLDQTVTQGIVSNKRESLLVGGASFGPMLQTDAPINRGSSGGPLVTLKAEVIGINSAIYGPSGVFSGMGFAIPVNRAKVFLAENSGALEQ
jgi:serine protease Do